MVNSAVNTQLNRVIKQGAIWLQYP